MADPEIHPPVAYRRPDDQPRPSGQHQLHADGAVDTDMVLRQNLEQWVPLFPAGHSVKERADLSQNCSNRWRLLPLRPTLLRSCRILRRCRRVLLRN
jgi:hypothetical protein